MLTDLSTLGSAVPAERMLCCRSAPSIWKESLAGSDRRIFGGHAELFVWLWRSSDGGAVSPRRGTGGFQLGKVKRPVEWTDENEVNKWEKQRRVIDPTETAKATVKRKTVNTFWLLVRPEVFFKKTSTHNVYFRQKISNILIQGLQIIVSSSFSAEDFVNILQLKVCSKRECGVCCKTR